MACLVEIIFVILFLLYVFCRLSCGISRSSACLLGKTALVTGANSGLGYQTALNLASRGCKIIMADVADMEDSKTNIIKHTNNTNIVTMKLDLSSLKSVRQFASEVVKKVDSLHILINNAGIGASAKNRTEDGLHPVMQINYFGHFLLTHLLIDLLKKSAPSRIVFTSSGLAYINNLSLENLNYEHKTDGVFSGIRIYANSKMAMIIAADIFAEKLQGTGVTCNSIQPGLVITPIHDKFSMVHQRNLFDLFHGLLMKIYAKSAWEGAQNLVHAAVSKKLEGASGKHFGDCVEFYKPLGAYRRAFCESIWEASEKHVGLKGEEKL